MHLLVAADGVRRVLDQHLAVLQAGDVIHEAEGEVHVVLYQHQCQFARQGADNLGHAHAFGRRQAGGRFVKQQQAGLAGEGKGELELALFNRRRTIRITNIIGLEDYTHGVVSCEMPVRAPLEALKAQGAVLVDINEFDMTPISQGRLDVLLTELKVDLNAYLSGANPNVKARTLADIIAFNRQEPRELKWFGQDFFETAEATAGYSDPAYVSALAAGKKATGPDGIDKMLKDNNVTALVVPTGDPTWLIDLVNGDHYGGSASTIPAVAGYPHLTMPMGLVSGLPVGLSFFGPAWSEQMLLSLGYAYEQATHARKPPTYQATMTLP